MMLGLGEQLKAAGKLTESRDIFWLSLPEIQGLISENKLPAETPAARQKQYVKYKPQELPERVISYGKTRGLLQINPPESTDNNSCELHGTPCSAGIVRARVRLVSYADELQGLDGCILATYATDPGFVVLFASASGILTERGSLLSHAAIVSREMGIPCIVGIAGLMSRLKDGDLVEMDGGTGEVRVVVGG